MRAITIIDSALRCVELPTPTPRKGELLIRVHAAGINRADILQRKGKYPPPAGASPVPGLEVAGEVVALGAGVKGFRKGDKVCALLEGGGYAEYAITRATQTLPVPKGLNYIQGAALPEALFTVWSNLKLHAGLKKGETLLVHGGSGGIGTAALAYAKAFGHTCYVTAGDRQKCRKLEQLGAAGAICYKEEDFAEILPEMTKGRGVDVVLDCVGGSIFQSNLNVLAKGGRLVMIGFLGGAKAEVNMAPVVMKHLTVTGTTLRDLPPKTKAMIARQLKREIWPRIARGEMLPVIDRVFPLNAAAAAQAHMEASRHFGKIILQCSGNAV